MKRRNFVQHSTAAFAGISLLGLTNCSSTNEKKETGAEQVVQASSPFFKLSLAQWAVHSQIHKGLMKHIEFAQKAKSFGVEALEYVSQLFPDGDFSDELLKEMNLRADGEGLANHLIMIDNNGDLAVNDASVRAEAVGNHKRWIDAAAVLNCSSVRINMSGDGTTEEIIANGSESMALLGEYAAQYDMNVLIENHGGFSSNIDELVKLFEQVNLPNCGALPDFGNWCIEQKDGECVNEFDKYRGIELLLPHTKSGISAKATKFDENGNEANIDYSRMLRMIKDSGFTGYIGIEHEVDDAEKEDEGIRKTKELLLREASKL